MRRAFTLLEVNLAIFIMATGALAMCALFALGFRESRQSVEDVAAAAFADAFLAPLVQGLSATNMTWSSWKQIGEAPSKSETKMVVDAIWPKDGWMAYVREPKNRDDFSYRMNGSARNRADTVFGQVIGKVPSEYRGSKPSIPAPSSGTGFEYGLVVTRRGPTIQLAFRLARRIDGLMSQPLFVSEVRFQGDPEK